MFRGFGQKTTTKSFSLPVFAISPKHLTLHHTINRSRIHSSSTLERSTAIANTRKHAATDARQCVLRSYCIFATVRVRKLHNVLRMAWHLYFIRLVCVIRVYALINWRKAARVMGEVFCGFSLLFGFIIRRRWKKSYVMAASVLVCILCTCDGIVCTECSSVCSALIVPRHDDNLVWVMLKVQNLRLGQQKKMKFCFSFLLPLLYQMKNLNSLISEVIAGSKIKIPWKIVHAK